MQTKNIEIKPFEDFEFKFFVNMFYSYFLNELNLELQYLQIEEVCLNIVETVKKGVVFLDLLKIENEPKGFIIYQIDSPESDWCQKEGFGFIREVFVERELRGQGLGRFIVTHVENVLRNKNVNIIYLTSDNGTFWSKCGYEKTCETGYKNQEPIYIKRIDNE